LAPWVGGTLGALNFFTMSQRAHFWVRLVALAVIAAVSYLPRADHAREAKGKTVAVAVP
jgi:hypothetical protein